MELLFVHSSEKVKIDIAGNMYTDGSYNNTVWKRYLALSNHLTLLMRRDKNIYSVQEAIEKFNPVDTDKIDFCELPNEVSSVYRYFSIALRKRKEAIIEGCVSKSDFVIARLPGDCFTIKAAYKLKKPYLIEVVGDPFDSLWNHSWKGKLLAIPARINLQKIVKNAPYVMYVTDEYLQKRYPTLGRSIGISDVIIDPIDKSVLEKRLESYRVIMQKCVLGTLGAINTKYKGHRFVMKALAFLKKNSPIQYEYQIAGGGDPSYIKKLARKYHVENEVKICGSIPHNEVNQWLDGLDIYIQPSLVEGLPRALVEAMSRALPCIGSSVGGIPELIDRSFICKKSRRMGTEIAKKITSLSKEQFASAALANFNKAHEYSSNALDEKRNLFYNEFLKGSGLISEKQHRYN